jgi:Rrf2 family protein
VRNTHLSMALHVLTLLAAAPEGLTSTVLASQVGTSPVYLRRVLGALAEAGIVSMRRGAGGGIMLQRAASGLRVDEVYQTLCANRALLPAHLSADAGAIPAVVLGLLQAAEERAVRHLGRFTLGDLLEESAGRADGQRPDTRAS